MSATVMLTSNCWGMFPTKGMHGGNMDESGVMFTSNG